MEALGREIRRISMPVDLIRERYDVIVVGSGYGGAIAASRMARAGRSVCLLERGKEFQPGEFPNTQVEAAGQFQVDLPDGHIGSRTGLYDLRAHPDINVFVGCGLGGTSLVNANVAVEADPRVFADSAWPDEIRADMATRLAEGYQRAREMLKPSPLPDDVMLPKLDSLQASSRELPTGCSTGCPSTSRSPTRPAAAITWGYSSRPAICAATAAPGATIRPRTPRR